MIRPTLNRLLPLVILAAFAAHAGAQVVPLDDVWFRVKLTSVGRTVDAGTLDLKKDKVGAKAFLHLELVQIGAEGVTYDWQLWTKQDGTWLMSDSGTHDFTGASSGDQLAVDINFDAQLGDGRFLNGRATLLFKLKLKHEGELKKAKVRTLGGETVDGSKNGEDLFVGSFSVKGNRVKEGKLPFTP